MNEHTYWPLPQAGGNHRKIHVLIRGRTAALVVPPGISRVLVVFKGAISLNMAGTSAYSNLNPNINN